jgi:hypothetical protein
VWLDLRHFYNADIVYRHRLFSRTRAMPAPLFMQQLEANLLFRVQGILVAEDATRTLADKRLFAAWCVRQGLPTAPMVLELEDGTVTRREAPPGALPPVDLFAKWGASFGGHLTIRWRHDAAHPDGPRWIDTSERAWTAPEIEAMLASRSRKGVVVVQPVLRNHPVLATLSPRALSTVRLMTTRRPGEAPRVLCGVLRMGTGNSSADNFAQGGIASPVDLETGVLDVARGVDADHRTTEHAVHPDTGCPIAGVHVPCWDEVQRLALEAHERLGDLAVVGWDVAVLPDGPVLLEGNWNPCMKLLQVATQVPLFATELATCQLAWLDRLESRIDAKWLADHRHWYPVPRTEDPERSEGADPADC